jgi:ribose transport system substrate-binding protein
VLGTVALVSGLLAAGCGGSSTPATTAASTGSSASPAGTDAGKALNIAYLSFAVANSYDAPMLAAAQATAASNNAKLTVFDANNDPKAQFSQLQNAISSGKYQGIIVQPIFGTALVPLVEQAIAKGIKVVNVDQILGPDFTTDQPQVTGLSANVTFLPSKIGTQLGQQVVLACQSKNLNPCKVGYIYSIKASTLDVAINKSFQEAIKGTPAVKVVAQGESFFTPALGLKATQNMLQAHPDLSLIVGADQGIQGAVQALDAAKKTGKVLLVGFGGSAASLAGVKSGSWFSDVAQAPASEGRLGVDALIKAIRQNTDGGGINPVADLPDEGVITKANADKFTSEWPG